MSDADIRTTIYLDADQQSASEATRILNETSQNIDKMRESATEASVTALRLSESLQFKGIDTQLRKATDAIGKIDATMGGIGTHYEQAMASAYEITAELIAIQDEIEVVAALNQLQNEDGLTEAGQRVIQLRSEYERLKHILADLPRDLKTGLQEANQEASRLADTLNDVDSSRRAGSARSDLSVISTFSNRIGIAPVGDLRIAGDIIEIVDSLPDLKESLAGIPASVSAAVSAIGTPFGLGMLGALGALSLGIKLFTDETRRREEEIAKAREEARRQAEQGVDQSLTTAQVITNILQDGTVGNAQEVLQSYEQKIQELNIFDSLISPVVDEFDNVRHQLETSGSGSLEKLSWNLGDFLKKRIEGTDQAWLSANVISGSMFGQSEAVQTFLTGYQENMDQLIEGIEQALPLIDLTMDDFLADPASAIEKLRDAINENDKATQQAEHTHRSVNQTIESGILVLETVEEIERRVNDERLTFAEQREQLTLDEIRISRMSADELERHMQTLEDQNKSWVDARQALRDFGDITEETANAINQYSQKIENNERIIQRITNDYLNSARERELAADIEKEMADAVIKYNRDTQAVRDQYERSRVASEQKLSDDLVRIEDRRIQQIERAQEQLVEREQAINLKASREEQDQATKLAHERQQQAVKIEREELKAEMDHSRKVRDIREKSAQQEFNLLLKRDFAGLFALRQRTDQEIKTAERASDEAIKAREQARGEQAQDEMAKLAFEREQRQTRYQREIADAHAQAQRTQQQAQATADRELQITRDKHNQQLRDLQDAKWRELGILKKGIHDEIALIESGSVSRVRAEMQTQSALRQAQQIGMMNRVNAQPIYQLPVGYTSRNSVVNNNNGNNTFNINGNNLSAMRQVVLNILEEIWSK